MSLEWEPTTEAEARGRTLSLYEGSFRKLQVVVHDGDYDKHDAARNPKSYDVDYYSFMRTDADDGRVVPWSNDRRYSPPKAKASNPDRVPKYVQDFLEDHGYHVVAGELYQKGASYHAREA